MANLNIEQPSSVEEILETGVLDNWYLVARDTDVDSKPVGLTRLSRDIVLWRDGDGALHCVEDFCPHRGAKLSLGKVCDGNVACAYHGVQVNGFGEIAAIPTEPDSPFVGRRAIRRYPVQERHGAIWVYFAVDEHAEPPELRFPDEFVRHKILDVIGDLYLLGRPLRGKVTARMSGHTENIKLLRKIQTA